MGNIWEFFSPCPGDFLPQQGLNLPIRHGVNCTGDCSNLQNTLVVRLQHVIENCFPATSKQRIPPHNTHLHHEYGAPQHHPPMPPTKDMGVFKQNRRGRPTATPLLTPGYSGVDLIGRAREWRHRLMGCIFLAKFGRRGGFDTPAQL